MKIHSLQRYIHIKQPCFVLILKCAVHMFIQRSQSPQSSYCSGPTHDRWRTVPYLHISALGQLYAVRHLLHAQAAVVTTSHKKYRCFVVGFKSEHKSLHFLSTSDSQRMVVSYNLLFKGTCTKMVCCEHSCFWQWKRVLFYMTIEKF